MYTFVLKAKKLKKILVILVLGYSLFACNLTGEKNQEEGSGAPQEAPSPAPPTQQEPSPIEPADPNYSTITSSSKTSVANGIDESEILISLKDKFGNPILNVTPTFSATDTGKQNVYSSCSPTDGNGTSSCKLKSKYAEKKLLYITSPIQKNGDTIHFTSGGINLLVPIELTDHPLSSKKNQSLTFENTQTSFNTEDYDGTVESYFEITGYNDSQTLDAVVSLVDSSGTPKSTISIPPQTLMPTRFRTHFSPKAGYEIYRITISATTKNDQVRVYSAKILVQQTNATQTKIYIPLTSYHSDRYSNSTYAYIEKTSKTEYTQPNIEYFSIWNKNSESFSDLATENAWALEAVISSNHSNSNASLVLFNQKKNLQVTESEISSNELHPKLIVKNFSNPSKNFDEQDSFTLKIKSNLKNATAYLHKAGLWVKLNNLTKGEVYYRVSLGSAINEKNATLSHNRILFENQLYSYPISFFEVIGSTEAEKTSYVQLYSHGTNDSGKNGIIPVINSALTLPLNHSPLRSPEIVLTSGDRYIVYHHSADAKSSLTQSFLVISFDQFR